MQKTHSSFTLRQQKLLAVRSPSAEFRPVRIGQALARVDGVRIDPAEYNHLTGEIIGSAIEVHRVLGAGLLESIYAPCFHYELSVRNLRFVAQQPVPIRYKSLAFGACYRVDLVVEDLVVVEIKSVAAVTPVFKSQLLTYMQLTDCPVGLLINFNVPRLVDGVTRMLNPCAGDNRGH